MNIWGLPTLDIWDPFSSGPQMNFNKCRLYDDRDDQCRNKRMQQISTEEV